ncbi:hypothetical protein CNEO3_490013 [Clostridium neonatale]|nr:hypothetical protein CNEO3_490013 [Clostridium neonatale]CAI3664424.1 hypothetical protein CNEO3_450017 [Clostridium neonatale]
MYFIVNSDLFSYSEMLTFFIIHKINALYYGIIVIVCYT